MDRPLRILFLTHDASPHIVGIGAGVGVLSAELRRRGLEVTEITSAAGPTGPLPPDDGVIRVPAWNVLERRLGVPYPVFGPQLSARLREQVERADVVHAHGFLYMSSLLGLRRAKR